MTEEKELIKEGIELMEEEIEYMEEQKELLQKEREYLFHEEEHVFQEKERELLLFPDDRSWVGGKRLKDRLRYSVIAFVCVFVT